MSWFTNISTPDEKAAQKAKEVKEKIARNRQAFATVEPFVRVALKDLKRFWYPGWFSDGLLQVRRAHGGTKFWVLTGRCSIRGSRDKAKWRTGISLCIEEDPPGSFRFRVDNGQGPLGIGETPPQHSSLSTQDLSQEELRRVLRLIAQDGPSSWIDDE